MQKLDIIIAENYETETTEMKLIIFSLFWIVMVISYPVCEYTVESFTLNFYVRVRVANFICIFLIFLCF